MKMEVSIMFWNLHPIDGTKYDQHWQPDMKGDLEIRPGGHQPMRLHFDADRKGLVVLMQGLAYVNPNTCERFVFAAVVEDWREVGFIPFTSSAEADPKLCDKEGCGHQYKMHSDMLFGFRQVGHNAYPDVIPNLILEK